MKQPWENKQNAKRYMHNNWKLIKVSFSSLFILPKKQSDLCKTLNNDGESFSRFIGKVKVTFASNFLLEKLSLINKYIKPFSL